MQRKLLLIVALAVATALCYTPTYTGPAYQAQMATSKRFQLQHQIDADATPMQWYTARLAELFVENLNTTFEYVGDDMPSQSLFGLEERPKLIHTVGATARARWVDLGNHSYTGVFAGGSESCFARLSLAKSPSAKDGIVPGLSFKFLRDGQKSANLMAMYSLLGQTSFNFFEHDFTNHAPDVDPNHDGIPLTSRLLYSAFQKASSWPTMMGLSDIATYNSTGFKAFAPSFPYRLVFHPTSAIHKMFEGATSSDDEYAFLTQLKAVPAGPLFQVYAQSFPLAPFTLIAQIELTETPKTSQFADSGLFFQHQRMEDDFALRPDWVAAAAKELESQRAQTPYAYPDLPWN